MCDRSSDPTEHDPLSATQLLGVRAAVSDTDTEHIHVSWVRRLLATLDAARERPSALETLRPWLRHSSSCAHFGLGPICTCGLYTAIARLTDPDTEEGTEQPAHWGHQRNDGIAPSPDTTEATLRAALDAADAMAKAWSEGGWRTAEDYSAVERPYERYIMFRAALQQPADQADPPECEREKWCDMPGRHRGECRSADDAIADHRTAVQPEGGPE